MIHDDLKVGVKVPPEALILEYAPFQFYLTGSRYAGVARPNSDWDFIVQDSENVRRWLEKEGFWSMSDPRYDQTHVHTSSLTRDIYVQEWFADGEYFDARLTIHIQVCGDAQLRRRIRDRVYAEHAAYDLAIRSDKDLRSKLWEDVASLLQRTTAEDAVRDLKKAHQDEIPLF